MKSSFLVIGCIPLWGGWGCYGLAMEDDPKERHMGLFHNTMNAEKVINTKTVVASYQEQSQEENVISERSMEPFGVGTSSKSTTTPLTEPTQTAKTTDLKVLVNSWGPFINETSKKSNSKEDMFRGVAAVLPTLVEVGMSTFKDTGQPLSFHTVDLEIKGLMEFSEGMESEHFIAATKRHIREHWKDNANVAIYNVKTSLISTVSIGHSRLKTETKRERYGCDSENTAVVQMQISVDFKTTDSKITEEVIITGALGPGGDNNYVMTLKDSGVESFLCIKEILQPVIIQPSTGQIQEQTLKENSVSRTIRPKTLLESTVPKHSISVPLLVQSQVQSKEITKDVFNLKPLRKLTSCNPCTDNEAPAMIKNGEKCSTTKLVNTKCRQSIFWTNNNYCQLSCFKASTGYDGDDCCEHHAYKEKNILTCINCTDEEPPWMTQKGIDCTRYKSLITRKCNLSNHWINRQYCQQSCFEGGNGYDNCECCDQTNEAPSTFQTNMPSQDHSSSVPSKVPTSPTIPPKNPEIFLPSNAPSKEPSSVPSSSPSVMPSTSPSGEHSSMPSSVPSINPSVDPSDTPSLEPSRLPSLELSKEPSSFPSSYPSVMPSTSPSGEPSSMPSCNICTNIPSPRMNFYGEDCDHSDSLLNLQCENDDEWMEKKYCEYSCYALGHSYPGSFCCEL